VDNAILWKNLCPEVNAIGFPYTVDYLDITKGQRDWQHLFAITGFFFMYFTITRGREKIVFYRGLVI